MRRWLFGCALLVLAACGGSTHVEPTPTGQAGGADAAAGAAGSAGASGSGGAGVATCAYLGESHASGESFPSRDGCNTCGCDGAAVSCTERGCACNAASEWWRNYFAKSAEACKAVKFACPEGTERFSNDCGCGCEQSEACGKVLSCQGDCADELASCPYSAAPR